MPAVRDALDNNRLNEIRSRAILGVNLWLSLNFAADRADKAALRTLWGQIRTLSVDTSDLIKALETERTDA